MALVFTNVFFVFVSKASLSVSTGHVTSSRVGTLVPAGEADGTKRRPQARTNVDTGSDCRAFPMTFRLRCFADHCWLQSRCLGRAGREDYSRRVWQSLEGSAKKGRGFGERHSAGYTRLFLSGALMSKPLSFCLTNRLLKLRRPLLKPCKKDGLLTRHTTQHIERRDVAPTALWSVSRSPRVPLHTPEGKLVHQRVHPAAPHQHPAS